MNDEKEAQEITKEKTNKLYRWRLTLTEITEDGEEVMVNHLLKKFNYEADWDHLIDDELPIYKIKLSGDCL